MANILFVEDDPLIVEIYERKFKEAGFGFVNVTTGKAALKAVLESSFDLVLLDLVIPEMSGMDVLKELRTNVQYSKDLKIVIFSNLSDPEDRKRAVELGVNGFIQKTDYTPTKLIAEIGRLLDMFAEQRKNSDSEGVGNPNANLAGSRKRILFIEDEPVFVDMFGRRLTQEGYEVIPYDNGLAAIEVAEQGGFDLIITDAMLPGITGEEIIERLKSGENTKHIPIFLLTASLEPSRLEEFSQSADVFKAFLKTQITPTELTREVNLVFSDEKK